MRAKVSKRWLSTIYLTMHVSPDRIDGMAHGRRAVTAGTARTALLLATYFGVTREPWLNRKGGHLLINSEIAIPKPIAITMRRTAVRPKRRAMPAHA